MSSGELFWWLRLKGTVITTLWWKVLLVLVYTTIVVYTHFHSGIQLNFPQTLIPIIGVVVGLLLAFRTNSAYDRYWEGRKLWTQMTQDVRKLTRSIWVGVLENKNNDSGSVKSIIEKKSALNLCLAFVVATKHYLREEYSYDYPDLKGLIQHLPKFNTPSSNISLQDQNEKPNSKRQFKYMAFDHPTPTNIPIEISYYILSYIKYVNEKGLCPGWVCGTMTGALSSMVDCLTSFERILRTPIPLAYTVHLHYSVWMYILTLPYQILGSMGWWTIPVVGLGSFCLLGIMSIGWEIENPFGTDPNDLPLDDFCRVLRREIQMITGTKLLTAEQWIYSQENLPFGESCPLNANQLCAKKEDELRRILADIAKADIVDEDNDTSDDKRKND